VAKKVILALEGFRQLAQLSSWTPVEVKLFKSLHSFWNQKSETKELLNINLAALHLSFMLSGQGHKVESLIDFNYYYLLFIKFNLYSHVMQTIPNLSDQPTL